MAVFAIPNPKKSIVVDFPIEKIKLSVQNINLLDDKYKLSKTNEIFNQYTFDVFEFLSVGAFVDIDFNSISESKTQINVEIRRKLGSFNQSYEITRANEHIEKIFSMIASLTNKTPLEIEQLKTKPMNIPPHQKLVDNRPIYKKKRFIIPMFLFGAFLFLFILTVIFGDTLLKNADVNSAKQNSAEALKENDLELKTKLSNNIKSIEAGDDLTKKEMTSVTEFQVAAFIYKGYAKNIKEGQASQDKEIINLANNLQKKVIASQEKNFPKLRLAFQKYLKDKLWEHDVDVKISGKGSTTLHLVGVYFAANKNIKSTQETISEILNLLRFKQTQYSWFKGVDEYTYYTIDSPKDNEIVE